MAASPALAIITVPHGGAFYTDITTVNTTGAAVTKDFLAGFGHYDPATEMFELYWGHTRLGVSIPVGEATNTIDCVAAMLGVDWDAVGAIGSYDAATGTFTMESAVVLVDALTVTGVAVTGMALRV